MKQLFVLLIFILSIQISKAQYFSGGTDPASTKWRTIETKHYKIIYPEEFEEESQFLANKMEYALLLVADDFNLSPKKIPLIIHTQTTTPNAFVAWAPKRMEFFTTPDQEQYAQDWFTQLALHENKHYTQFELIEQNTPKIIKFLFGEQLTPAYVGVFIPMWYMEGDAVVSETALSKAGRGRQPSFTMTLKAQLCERGIYNYNKALFGSYKHQTPGAYELGYHLVGQSKLDLGSTIWKKKLETVANSPYLFTSFNKLYTSGISSISEEYQNNKQQKPSQHTTISPEKHKEDINYKHPHLVDKNAIIAVKNSLSRRAHITMIDEQGKETELFEPGLYYNTSLSVKGNLICWAEQTTDPRWSHRSYSEIRIHNTDTKKTKHLTKKTRYFAPALSHDKTKVAAVEVNDLYEKSLVVLDARNGQQILKLPSPNNVMLQHPAWSQDNSEIYVISISEDYKQIISYDITSGVFNEITAKTVVDIKHPIENNNYLYFVGAFNQTDNIYRINLAGKKMEQVTDVVYGADYPEISESGKELYFSNYTASGFELAKINLEEINFTQVPFPYQVSFPLADALSDQSGRTFQANEIPTNHYSSKKYSKLKNLLNIHSWSPMYLHATTQTVNSGIFLMSQNHLSTLSAITGVEFDPNLSMPRLYGELQYTGLYPTFNLTFSKGLAKSGLIADSVRRNAFNIGEFSVGTSLPQTFRRGNKTVYFKPQINFSRILWEVYPEALNEVKYQEYSNDLNYQFYGQVSQMKSVRDINPKWGQILTLHYRHSVSDKPNENYIFTASGHLFFPGILPHHSLLLQPAYQIRSNNGVYPYEIAYSRGYNNNNDIIRSTKILVNRLNYTFPMMYPDLDLKLVAYLKRIQMNLFYDLTFGATNNKWNDYQSAGIDIIFDLHILRFMAPFQLGVRSVYNFNDGKVRYQPIFQINFYDIY